MKYLDERKDRDGFLSDTFFDKFFDYPYTKFGRNMQKMKTDIIEYKDKYVIKIDIPGYDKKDIQVHVGDKYLTVYVKKEEEHDEKLNEGKYVYQERYVGTSSRSFYVGDVCEDSIKASLKNGTLTLEIPKEANKEKEKTWIKID
jgi:HSP20 family molecular chaperone IbpA